jgi:hypothetical protein
VAEGRASAACPLLANLRPASAAVNADAGVDADADVVEVAAADADADVDVDAGENAGADADVAGETAVAAKERAEPVSAGFVATGVLAAD